MTFFTSLPEETQVTLLEIAAEKAGVVDGDRTNAEQVLRQFNQQFALVLKGLMDGISAVDVE